MVGLRLGIAGGVRSKEFSVDRSRIGATDQSGTSRPLSSVTLTAVTGYHLPKRKYPG